MADTVKIEAEGLRETVRLLGKVDKALRKEAGKVVREATVKIKRKAQGRLASSPGVSRSYPLRKTAIVHRATATKASIGWNMGTRNGWAIMGAEFGAKSHWVPYHHKDDGSPSRKGVGRKVSQGSMIRRTYPVWRGNSTTIRGKAGPGWIVMPTLRREVPLIADDLQRDLLEVFDKSARAQGVPR